MDQSFKIAALYNFVAIPNPSEVGEMLEEFCRAHDIRGTLIIAPEGINGTIAGSVEAIDKFAEKFSANTNQVNLLKGAEIKFSFAEHAPFLRLKIRLKPEIVTLRAPGVDPTTTVGTYVEAEDWNDLIKNEDLVLLDTRNDYEYAIGTFEGAIDPNTKTFTEFKDYVKENLDPAKNKKVAMFCTGGIRCEKASSFMLQQGFEEVFHLRGGILKYLENVPQEESKWQGECFVFDERVSVGHNLVEGEAELCRACRYPLTKADRAHPDYIAGEQCPHCAGEEFAQMRASAKERNRQMQLAEEKGIAHLGDDAVNSARARAKAKRKKRAEDRARSAS